LHKCLIAWTMSRTESGGSLTWFSTVSAMPFMELSTREHPHPAPTTGSTSSGDPGRKKPSTTGLMQQQQQQQRHDMALQSEQPTCSDGWLGSLMERTQYLQWSAKPCAWAYAIVRCSALEASVHSVTAGDSAGRAGECQPHLSTTCPQLGEGVQGSGSQQRLEKANWTLLRYSYTPPAHPAAAAAAVGGDGPASTPSACC
jgi:hypothetical protein